MEYWLAPLERVTDCAFRTLAHQFGADMTITPFVKIDSFLKRKKKATLRFDLLNDTPTQVQLMTNNLKETQNFVDWFNKNEQFILPESKNLLSESDIGKDCEKAERTVFLSKVKGFNLNLCCPDPYIARTGRGAALVKRTKRVSDLVDILKETELPVSLKMRLGLNQRQKNLKVYLRLVENCQADRFIIHARHGEESYDDKADFSVFPELIETGKPIIANCDVRGEREARSFEEMGAAGVMIGRSAVINPQIFSKLKDRFSGRSERDVKAEYEELAYFYNIPKQNFLFTINHIGHFFEHR